MLYKDRLGKNSKNTNSQVKVLKVVNFKDFSTSDLQQDAPRNEENILPICQENVALETIPILKLRRYSRTVRPPLRFSLSLNFILLTNRSELENYKEVVQVDESIKWELAMQDEMNSLMFIQR